MFSNIRFVISVMITAINSGYDSISRYYSPIIFLTSVTIKHKL